MPVHVQMECRPSQPKGQKRKGVERCWEGVGGQKSLVVLVWYQERRAPSFMSFCVTLHGVKALTLIALDGKNMGRKPPIWPSTPHRSWNASCDYDLIVYFWLGFEMCGTGSPNPKWRCWTWNNAGKNTGNNGPERPKRFDRNSSHLFPSCSQRANPGVGSFRLLPAWKPCFHPRILCGLPWRKGVWPAKVSCKNSTRPSVPGWNITSNCWSRPKKSVEDVRWRPWCTPCWAMDACDAATWWSASSKRPWLRPWAGRIVPKSWGSQWVSSAERVARCTRWPSDLGRWPNWIREVDGGNYSDDPSTPVYELLVINLAIRYGDSD